MEAALLHNQNLTLLVFGKDELQVELIGYLLLKHFEEIELHHPELAALDGDVTRTLCHIYQGFA